MKKSVELAKPGSPEALLDQGMLNFIAGDYRAAMASWQRVLPGDTQVGAQLSGWIDRARANQEAKLQSAAWAEQGSRSPHLQY